MSCFVTGTDTDVGKTIVSSWLMLQYPQTYYWKPIQSGQVDRDCDTVKKITQTEDFRIFQPSYDLVAALSPHESARREGRTIDLEDIEMPEAPSPIIVEGAGGIFVPLNDQLFMIDLMKKLELPVLLVARTGLGTINHTLMSLEILRQYEMQILGVVLSGDPVSHNREAIENYGRVEIIAELPQFDTVDGNSLKTISPKIALDALM